MAGGAPDMARMNPVFPKALAGLALILSGVAAASTPAAWLPPSVPGIDRSEEHTSELQSPTTIAYAVFCL